jgi:hypothetical protein
VVLLCFIRPIQALFAEGREHGRTIPLAVIPNHHSSPDETSSRHATTKPSR